MTGPPVQGEAERTIPEAHAHAVKVEARLGRRRRYRLVRALFRWTVAVAFLVVAISVAALSQTREGQEFVLDSAIDRIRDALAGELVVGGIRGRTLLTGATLIDVRLDAANGREFLRADSVVVRYSLASILSGGPPIRSTVFWGAEVEISQYSAEDVLNVTRILAEGEPDTTAAATGRPIDLGRIGIRDATVRLLTPAPRHSDRTVRAPDGSPLRRILFESLDLDLEDARLRPGASVSFEARLGSLSSSVHIVDDPLVVREVFGDVTFGAQGIRIQNAQLRLPSTFFEGGVTMGPARPGERWSLRAELTAREWGDLEDLAWIDPRLPSGRFRGSANLRVPDAVEVDFDEVEIELEASRVVANGSVRFTEELPMRAMRLTVSPLAVARLEPWMGIDFPLDGWLSGEATFSGTLRDLATAGRLTLVPTGFGGTPTTADFSGTVHRGAGSGATSFEMRLDPLNFTILEAYWPGAPWDGTGTARIELDGPARSGMTLVADVRHESDFGETSRLVGQGLAQRLDDGEWVVDMRGELAPLSVTALGRMAPDLELSGTVAGPVRAQGRLDDLHVGGDLVAEGGTLAFDADVDLRDPASLYRIEADAEELPISALSGLIPGVTSWSGRLEMTGEGFGLDSLAARATLHARHTLVGPVVVDTAAAQLRIERGVLVTDTLIARVSGVDVEGRGRFGLAPGTWGSSRVAFRSESIVGLRPLVMGVSDSVMARDTLGDLDREFLRASGVEPDTLPTLLDVRMAGAVRGAASLSGELRAFDLGLLVDLVDGEYKHNEVDTARIAFTATDLPRTTGSWGVGMSARGVVWQGRTFEQGGFEAEMIRRAGNGRIELVRSTDEHYRAAGGFQLDSAGGEVGVTEAQIQVRDEIWNLARPSRIAWSGTSLQVDSLLVSREGPDPMSFHADGVLTRGGESSFRMRVDGLHLDRVVHVAQLPDLEVAGHLDLDLDVTGPSEAPRINGAFRVDGPRYGTVELTRLDGTLDYADRRVDFSLNGWDGVRDVLEGSGSLPIDLSLAVVEDRILDRPMELRLTADSLDAAIALSYLTSLQQVIGVVSADVEVGGTLREPRPEGTVTLDDAEWTIEAIGVRHEAVDGRLTLNPDRTIDVDLASGGVGTSTVTGTVTLAPLRDPRLDLTFAFRRFQAVARPDVEGLISGDFRLGGSYRRPVARGALTVDEGTVYVDEFRRVAGVVDLTDPLLFREALGVDTTALVAQPLIAGLRNPFFDNLRVDIDLAVPRNTWLRSVETNVEMAGDLLVAYDRGEGDLVLIGELQALRGSHLVLGRNFQLDGGTVSFIGRPGLNPDLDIDASTRVFRRQEEDLEVTAHVGGTLVQPLVTLSTDEPGTSEADVVSYLIFGQASGELGANQSAVFGRIADPAVSTVVSGGLTFVSGALANQFGAVLAQETGFLDYVSVQTLGTSGTLANQLYGRSQVEAGKYLGSDVFAVVVLRPSSGGVENASRFGGARVEWELGDLVNGEVFVEDRFLRSGGAGFALPELLRDNLVWGIFLFRDWGY